MKRSLWLGFYLAVLSALASAQVPPLGGFVPDGAQVVVEIHQVNELAVFLRDAGLRPNPTSPPAPAGAEDRIDWQGVRMLLAARLDWPASAPAGVLALGFPDEARYERFCRLLPPPGKSGEAPVHAGPFRIYPLDPGGAPLPLPESMAGFAAGRRLTVAHGQRMVILGLQVEAKELVAQYISGNRPAAGLPAERPGPAGVGEPVLSFRIDTRFLENLAGLGAAKVGEYLSLPAGPAAAGAAPQDLGRMFFRDIPKEKIEAFLLGFGIQDWQSVTGTLRRDGERYGVEVDARVRPQAHLVQQYLRELAARPLQAPLRLPAGVPEYGAYRLDLPLLYRLVADHARDTLGPKGAALSAGIELACQLKLGLSFRDQLLPMLGAEYGFAAWPGTAPADRVGFFIPNDPALLATCLQALGKAGLVRVEETRLEDAAVYALSGVPAEAEPFRLHLMLKDGVVYVARVREALDRVRQAAGAAGTVPRESPGGGCIHVTRGISWFESAAGTAAGLAGRAQAGEVPPTAGPAEPALAEAWQKTMATPEGLHFEASIPRAALAAWKRSLDRLKPLPMSSPEPVPEKAAPPAAGPSPKKQADAAGSAHP